MTRLAIVALAAVALVALEAPLPAQGVVRTPPDRQLEPGAAGRTRLENEIRRGIARVVRQRVGLDDDQMRRLGPIAQRYEQQRRQLQADERGTRASLRSAILNEGSVEPRAVDAMLQKLLDIQKRRLALLEAEQGELAGFMTPVQRARYMAVQEQIRRRLELMRQRRAQLLEGDSGGVDPSPRGLRRRLPP